MSKVARALNQLVDQASPALVGMVPPLPRLGTVPLMCVASLHIGKAYDESPACAVSTSLCWACWVPRYLHNWCCGMSLVLLKCASDKHESHRVFCHAELSPSFISSRQAPHVSLCASITSRWAPHVTMSKRTAIRCGRSCGDNHDRTWDQQ